MGEHLVAIHRHVRAETAQVLDVVEQVAAGERSVGDARSVVAGLTMRQNYWALGSFCAGYCALVTQHHMIEDAAMFPPLAAQDATLAPVTARLSAEHEEVAAALSALDAVLVAVVAGRAGIDQVRHRAVELAALLTSHLDYEEEQLVPALGLYA